MHHPSLSILIRLHGMIEINIHICWLVVVYIIYYAIFLHRETYLFQAMS